METFQVLTPGAYTTVQDKGRYGYQHMGIPVSGALDSFAYRVANMLVGNPQDSAVLEITVTGPRLAVLREADVALTGAEMGMMLNGKPVDGWASFRVKNGDVLAVSQIKSGCRGYMAVSGGIDVPAIMGSRSTYVGGKLGGYHGRPLKKGDLLKTGEGELLKATRRLPAGQIPTFSSQIILRAVPGPQDDFFQEGMTIFFQSEFKVSPSADRMGYRLHGPAIGIREDMPKSIISEPSIPGGVQIPADEQPIILLVEQTVGGYTKIATVISTDLSRVAQAVPGNAILFERVTLETAHSLYRDRERVLQEIADQLSNT